MVPFEPELLGQYRPAQVTQQILVEDVHARPNDVVAANTASPSSLGSPAVEG